MPMVSHRDPNHRLQVWLHLVCVKRARRLPGANELGICYFVLWHPSDDHDA